jgi:hypothetical protein
MLSTRLAPIPLGLLDIQTLEAPLFITTVTMKTNVLCYVTPCSLSDMYHRLGGRSCLCLQDKLYRKHSSIVKMEAARFSYSQYVKLRGVTPHK